MTYRPFNHLQNMLIALVILFMGIMAGFFWTYSFNINFATANLDGESYAIIQSLFNENVRHSMFFTFFMGSGAIAAIATLTQLPQWKRPTFWLLATATVTYIAGIIIFTQQVNLPLNAYTESWNPELNPIYWTTIYDFLVE